MFYPAGLSSTSSCRVATWSPGLTARRATVPRRRPSSRAASSWPRRRPAAGPCRRHRPRPTSTATTLPFIGARSFVSDAAPAPGARARRIERLAHGEIAARRARDAGCRRQMRSRAALLPVEPQPHCRHRRRRPMRDLDRVPVRLDAIATPGPTHGRPLHATALPPASSCSGQASAPLEDQARAGSWPCRSRARLEPEHGGEAERGGVGRRRRDLGEVLRDELRRGLAGGELGMAQGVDQERAIGRRCRARPCPPAPAPAGGAPPRAWRRAR